QSSAITQASDFDGAPLSGTILSHVTTSQTFYTPSGKIDDTIDQYGAQTKNIYDVRGLLIETRTQSKNAAGTPTWIVMRTVYDNNGRATYTSDAHEELDPDNSPQAAPGTHTVYDALGRVIKTERLSETLLINLTAVGQPVGFKQSQVYAAG